MIKRKLQLQSEEIIVGKHSFTLFIHKTKVMKDYIHILNAEPKKPI